MSVARGPHSNLDSRSLAPEVVVIIVSQLRALLPRLSTLLPRTQRRQLRHARKLRVDSHSMVACLTGCQADTRLIGAVECNIHEPERSAKVQQERGQRQGESEGKRKGEWEWEQAVADRQTWHANCSQRGALNHEQQPLGVSRDSFAVARQLVCLIKTVRM